MKDSGLEAGKKAARIIMSNTESANEARAEIRAAINVLKGARSNLVKGKAGRIKYKKKGFFDSLFE